MFAPILFSAALLAQDPGDRIAEIVAQAPQVAESAVIGRSAGDRPIHLVTLRSGDRPADQRPGVLILAGADGGRPLGTDLAFAQLESLVAGAQDGARIQALLESCTVYVLPVLNPDGVALGRHGNARALDRDRDGATDEDAPRDLNGDGVISMMRWPSPEGEWIVDPDEPRLLRKADPSEGERGTHHMAMEAADTDGDEERGEDPGQGIQIHRNFSHRFDEFDRSTGPFPMSESETRALADFVFAHRDIVLAFVWGGDSNLFGKVKTAKPKPRVQLDGVLEDDKEIYEQAGELYRELTGRKEGAEARHDGSPWSWLMFQIGATTFASDVWSVPPGDKKEEQSDEQARLAACDAAGTGFVEWQSMEHPTLGAVEIGGFVHGMDHALLPAEERETLFQAHTDFVLDMVDRLPKVRIASFTKESLPGGAWKIEAVIENEGRWPAPTAIAERTRRFSRPRVVLDTGSAAVLAGNERQLVETLTGLGGRQEFQWVVTGASGTSLSLTLTVDPTHEVTAEVTL